MPLQKMAEMFCCGVSWILSFMISTSEIHFTWLQPHTRDVPTLMQSPSLSGEESHLQVREADSFQSKFLLFAFCILMVEKWFHVPNLHTSWVLRCDIQWVGTSMQEFSCCFPVQHHDIQLSTSKTLQLGVFKMWELVHQFGFYFPEALV